MRYAIFAIVATIANLGTQRLVLMAGDSPEHFLTAMGSGTIVGLLVKYFLDKRWIFFDQSSGLRAHGRKFTIYTAMGVLTTAIFWANETAFWLIWGTDLMRETGAVLGLILGYIVKYNLDKRFVFTDGREAER